MKPFDARQAIATYDPAIQIEFIKEAEQLFSELETFYLMVVLCPAPDPRHTDHKIRIVVNSNPPWYRELYHTNPNFKRNRFQEALTRIAQINDQPYREGRYIRGSPIETKRYDILGRQISNPGWFTHYHYDTIARQSVFRMIVEGYEEDGFERIPNNKVREYFNLPLIELEKEVEELTSSSTIDTRDNFLPF